MKNKLTVSIDYRIISIVLLVIILAMLAIWRPWQADATSLRKITLTGTGKVTATPDSYQFNPSFEKPTTAELTAHITTVTARLKELGVEEKNIQLQGSSYDSPRPLNDKAIAPVPDRQAAYAYLTIKVDNKELAQKVQDYITESGAQGQLTPQPTFSEEKQKQLKEEAREKAIADAKSQAEKTAKNLNAKLGRVIEVSDTEGQSVMPFERGIAQDMNSSSGATTSLPILSGEQDITATVQVIFEIK